LVADLKDLVLDVVEERAKLLEVFHMRKDSDFNNEMKQFVETCLHSAIEEALGGKQ